MCWWEEVSAGLQSNLLLRGGLSPALGQVGCVFDSETSKDRDHLHYLSPHTDALLVWSREEKGLDKTFCTDSTVIHHRAQVLHCYVLQWNPMGKNHSCFYLPGNLWSHLLKNLFILTMASACLSQAERDHSKSVSVPICKGVCQQSHRGLQQGSFKYAEHTQQKEKTGNLSV